MSAKESALAKVQDLYVMQGALWDVLDAEQIDTDRKKDVEGMLRKFKQLLKEVDWHYMGGEDVLQSMEGIPQEVTQKLRKVPVRRAPVSVASRVEKKPAPKQKVPARRPVKSRRK